jgi:alcohol dehydrogenase class IV
MSVYAVLRGPRELVFGRGQRAGIVAAVASLGQRALVCTDARMAAQPEFGEIVAQLRAAGVDVLVYDRVEPELPAEGVSACAEEVRDHAPDVVVGVGGGSCLDHAKLVSLLLTHGGVLADYYGERLVPGPVLPVVAVPTTAGTGSEVTPVAVLTDRARTLKVGISSPHLIPHTAIVDPDLSSSAPPVLTAHTGADALAHCIESLCAVRREPESGLAHASVFVGKSALTDRYAVDGISLIGRSLRRAVENGADASAREDLALGSLYAGLAFGTAGTAAAHALQYPVGALTHTSHGVGVGVLLPYVMAFNRPVIGDELQAAGTALGASGDVVEAVAALLADVGIPRTLAELGITENQLDDVARLGMQSGRLVRNNPRELTEDGCRAIARSAFTGDLAVLGEERET